VIDSDLFCKTFNSSRSMSQELPITWIVQERNRRGKISKVLCHSVRTIVSRTPGSISDDEASEFCLAAMTGAFGFYSSTGSDQTPGPL